MIGVYLDVHEIHNKMSCPAKLKTVDRLCGNPSKYGVYCGKHQNLNTDDQQTNFSESEHPELDQPAREARASPQQLDQFYTRPNIAEYCYFIIRLYVDIFDIVLEPSAGGGAFFNLLPKDKRQGIDIDPRCEHVMKADFLEFKPIATGVKYLVVGNPPFGRVSSLAVQFFNKASEFAQMIAFIVPRTFKKVSLQNRLNMDFHLIYNEDLPEKPCCFEPSISARCCFQVWVRTGFPYPASNHPAPDPGAAQAVESIKHLPPCPPERRQFIVQDKNHPDFSFVKQEEADVAFRRCGKSCGEVRDQGLNELPAQSWHWIKSNIDKDELIARLRSLDCSISSDTACQKSLGQQELVGLYREEW